MWRTEHFLSNCPYMNATRSPWFLVDIGSNDGLMPSDKNPLSEPMLTKSPVAHYTDVIMDAVASQITSLTIVYSNVYSGADRRKHQSSASLAFVRGIHRWPVNSPHKRLVTRKLFPFDDVILRMASIGHSELRIYDNHSWCIHVAEAINDNTKCCDTKKYFC